ncbi:maleylacetate reductase [Pseudomonas sp. Y24-6]|uniref:maleylacetate reductase n=1 Tax=Pseudomonas sp. Y24-6 TaxID=2750013 RepID=UPI001CE14CA8|nr:maleylacetate reductase [Pseudomonas sp. Y24-6]MCA4964309.1 maleylacetate reductase [Pseudomonas sp. Y24-6]
MKPFIYNEVASRVVFGEAAYSCLEREAQQLNLSRVLVICTPDQKVQALRAAKALGERCVGICDLAVMHVPAVVVNQAIDQALKTHADGTLAIGGGSTIGLAKALALRIGLPIIAVPTTYAGSEMTPLWGITESQLKTTGRNPRVQPLTVIYDPVLTYSLPRSMSITSGMNAIAHAVEGLYTRDANPIISLMAEEGIRVLAGGLSLIKDGDSTAQGRSQCLYGAWLCGKVLGNVGMALHHKLCHTLGGTFNLPHAETHTAVLPHALAYNLAFAPQAEAGIQRALGCSNAAQGLYDLARDNGACMSLKTLGLKAEDVDVALDIALDNPYWNPRPLEREPLRQLLQNAYEGVRP